MLGTKNEVLLEHYSVGGLPGLHCTMLRVFLRLTNDAWEHDPVRICHVQGTSSHISRSLSYFREGVSVGNCLINLRGYKHCPAYWGTKCPLDDKASWISQDIPTLKCLLWVS